MFIDVWLSIGIAVETALMGTASYLMNRSDLSGTKDVDWVAFGASLAVLAAVFVFAWVLATYAVKIAAEESTFNRMPTAARNALVFYDNDSMSALSKKQVFLVNRLRVWFPYGAMMTAFAMVSLSVALVQLTEVQNLATMMFIIFLAPLFFVLEMRPLVMHELELLAATGATGR